MNSALVKAVWLLSFLCILFFLGFEASSKAQETRDPRAIQELDKMIQLFKNTQNMEFTVSASEERFFKGHTPLNFVFEYSVRLSDDDKLKIILPRANGVSELIYNDGVVTYHDVTRKIYTQGDFKESIPELISILRDEFQVSVPGIDLVDRNQEKTIDNWTQKALYIGMELLPFGLAHHLAFYNPEIDWQLWIYEETGLPGYLILTYKMLPDDPQTHVRYGNWNLDPKFPANEFNFVPPRGVEPFALPNFSKEPKANQSQK